ncbi:MAG: hypothetical protein AAFN93_02565, partial [Bacteroidota bacterium]
QQSKVGFNKLISILFGQFTQVGMAQSAAPPWFFEGDATVIESTFTHSGRGRIPAHDLVFRSNLLGGKRFGYHKQHLLSFKDFIPDHYRLGYYYIGHIRKRTGDREIWEKVTRSAFSWPFIPFTFSNSLKKHTGYNIVQNYEMMMDEMEGLWKKQLEGLELTEYTRVNSRSSKAFTDYSFPQKLANGDVLAMKSGIGDIEQFVVFKDGKETKVFVPGFINRSSMLSSAGNTVVWNELHFDPRWRTKTYSVIKSYNAATDEKRIITRKSRYTGAAISSDESKIVTVLSTEEYKHHLVVIDSKNGKEIKRFENENNGQYGMPRWSQNGEQIVALKTTEEGKSVVLVDYKTGEEKILIPYSHENIGHPVLHDEYLIYGSPYSGIDNIYAMHLETGKRFQITSAKYGAYSAVVSPDGESIYYNDHSVDGLDVARIEYEPDTWKPLEEVEDRNINYNQELAEQENHEDILSEVPDKEYPVKKYSKLTHALNIHSWGPFTDTNLNTIEAGIFSKDILSTTEVTLGYTYDNIEESGFASAGISYQGFYPVIDFTVDYGGRTERDNGLKYTWDETTVEAGVRLPLALTNSKYVTELSVGNFVGLRDVSNFTNNVDNTGRLLFTAFLVEDDTVNTFRVDPDLVPDGQVFFNRFSIRAFNILKQSDRDINPAWGQLFWFDRLNDIGGDFTGALTSFRYSLFFPGIFKHHSFFVQGGFQSRQITDDLNLITFRNRIPRPRGHSYFTDEKFTSILFNYTLPLWYPDIALGPVLNLQRVRLNMFYDYGEDNILIFRRRVDNSDPFPGFDGGFDYKSYGAELTVDLNVMRFRPRISVGARFVYNEESPFRNAGSTVEFILGGVSF